MRVGPMQNTVWVGQQVPTQEPTHTPTTESLLSCKDMTGEQLRTHARANGFPTQYLRFIKGDLHAHRHASARAHTVTGMHACTHKQTHTCAPAHLPRSHGIAGASPVGCVGRLLNYQEPWEPVWLGMQQATVLTSARRSHVFACMHMHAHVHRAEAAQVCPVTCNKCPQTEGPTAIPSPTPTELPTSLTPTTIRVPSYTPSTVPTEQPTPAPTLTPTEVVAADVYAGVAQCKDLADALLTSTWADILRLRAGTNPGTNTHAHNRAGYSSASDDRGSLGQACARRAGGGCGMRVGPMQNMG